jgi:hypothetical protein
LGFGLFALISQTERRRFSVSFSDWLEGYRTRRVRAGGTDYTFVARKVGSTYEQGGFDDVYRETILYEKKTGEYVVTVDTGYKTIHHPLTKEDVREKFPLLAKEMRWTRKVTL